MKSFRSKPLAFCAIMLSMIILCGACRTTPAPVMISLTPDFSNVELPASSVSNVSSDLLSQPGRVAIYATTCYNYGTGIHPDYVTQYQHLGDCHDFFHNQARLALPTQIDFFWCGYSASARQEEINLYLQADPGFEKQFITITSNWAEQEAIIYQSCNSENIMVTDIALSSGRKTEIYTRDQFAEATQAGNLPETLTTYYFPGDIDYICKVSFQINF